MTTRTQQQPRQVIRSPLASPKPAQPDRGPKLTSDLFSDSRTAVIQHHSAEGRGPISSERGALRHSTGHPDPGPSPDASFSARIPPVGRPDLHPRRPHAPPSNSAKPPACRLRIRLPGCDALPRQRAITASSSPADHGTLWWRLSASSKNDRYQSLTGPDSNGRG